MAEWLKAHAWKLIPVALSNAHRHAPTHSASTSSRNKDEHRSVPVDHGVCPGLQGVSDTVLTQNAVTLSGVPADVRWYAMERDINDLALLPRKANESAARQAMPRSESMPSK
jgi:hypothetical protein